MELLWGRLRDNLGITMLWEWEQWERCPGWARIAASPGGAPAPVSVATLRAGPARGSAGAGHAAGACCSLGEEKGSERGWDGKGAAPAARTPPKEARIFPGHLIHSAQAAGGGVTLKHSREQGQKKERKA